MICIIQNTGILLLVAKNKLVLSVFVLFQTYIAEGTTTCIRTTTCFLDTMHIVSLDNNGSGINHIYIIYDNLYITNIKYIKCKVQDKVSAFLQQLGQLDLYNKLHES
jgi:hypothetical protein